VYSDNPRVSEAGTNCESCNTATGGQELDLDGGPSAVSLLGGWLWIRTGRKGKKEAPSIELSPTYSGSDMPTFHKARMCSGMVRFMLALAFGRRAFLGGRQSYHCV
jgi:hypothetical protein